jgi:curved DNA-binding protein CbpA
LAARSDAEKLTGEERMKAIKNAYDTLGDPYLCSQYDRILFKSVTPDVPVARTAATRRKRKASVSSEPSLQKKKRRTELNRKHDSDWNGWHLDITMSSKNIVVGNVRDVTTPKMHHICVSLAFDMEICEDDEAPQDGSKGCDMRLNVEGTPGGRDIKSVTLTLKELHLQSRTKRYARNLTVTTVCPRKAPPLAKPFQASFNFEPPIRPQLQARVCATNTIFNRAEPPENVRDFTQSVLQPVFPRACPESHITTLHEIKLSDTANTSIRWVDLASVGGRHSVEERDGDKWHRMVAVGYRVFTGPTDTYSVRWRGECVLPYEEFVSVNLQDPERQIRRQIGTVACKFRRL